MKETKPYSKEKGNYSNKESTQPFGLLAEKWTFNNIDHIL